MITPFFHLDCFIYEPIEKMMESFKEKFKIAKVLASIFTHSSTLEENESYHKWINENPEHQKIADRILNQRTYEEHSLLIKSFSSQKAWEKIYPLLNGEKAPNLFLWKRSMRYAALILLLMIPASYPIYKGEFYQFNLSSCIRQQNSLTAQFVSFSLSNLANIFYPPQFLQ